MPEGKVGPFTTRTAAIGFGVGVVGYLAYKYVKGRRAGASTALAGGGTIPPGGATSSTPAHPTTLADWQNMALQFGTSPIDTLNAITNWFAGNCVDQSGYNAIAQAIQSLGLPPGYNQFQVLTVCANGTGSGSGSGSGAGGTGSSSGGGTGGAAGGGNSAFFQNVAPVSPAGIAAPTVGTTGQPLPGNPHFLPPGAVMLPAPVTNDFAGTSAVAATLQPGQNGVLPNGLRVSVQTLPGGATEYVYS